MKKVIKAIDDKVIVRLVQENVSEGGIIMPEGVQQVPQKYGQVLSIGDLVKNKELKVGDVIAFHQRGGQDMVVNREIWSVVKYDEIYGTVFEIDDDEYEKHTSTDAQPIMLEVKK